MTGLNDKLQSAGSNTVSMLRFRPNIVIGDAPAAADKLEAHDEDRLESFQISTEQGLVHLKPVKPCPRCPMPNIDPATATVSPEVGDMLQTYRQDARVKGAPTFGMNLVAIQQGAHQDCLLKVGQTVSANYLFE